MTLEATRCPNDHYHYPSHPRCPDCGESPTERIDLSDREATVVTWTSAHSTPPGVRSPNYVAIVEFDLGESEDANGERDEDDGRNDGDGETGNGTVRAIGGLTTSEVEIGDRVRPVYVGRLREPGAGVREPESQEWDGYRFEPARTGDVTGG